jgi:hypothetical protein
MLPSAEKPDPVADTTPFALGNVFVALNHQKRLGGGGVLFSIRADIYR